jgi:hypothetical protein
MFGLVVLPIEALWFCHEKDCGQLLAGRLRLVLNLVAVAVQRQALKSLTEQRAQTLALLVAQGCRMLLVVFRRLGLQQPLGLAELQW